MAEQNEGIKFSLEGREYNLDDFELGELEWLEEEIGLSFAGIDAGDPESFKTLMSMKSITRLVYLLKKRDNPDFTLDDARKIKLSTVVQEPNGNGKTAANGKPAAAKRPTRAAAAAKA